MHAHHAAKQWPGLSGMSPKPAAQRSGSSLHQGSCKFVYLWVHTRVQTESLALLVLNAAHSPGSDFTASRQPLRPNCHEGGNDRRGSSGSNGASGRSVQAPEDPAPFFLDQSQQSLLPGKAGAGPSKRKASITNPIHQTANKVLKKKVATTPARGSKQQKNRMSGMR